MRGNCSVNFWQLLNYLSECDRSRSRYQRGGKTHRHGCCQQRKADKVVNV